MQEPLQEPQEDPQVLPESQGEPEQEPDYKAKTEELEALVAKLQNDQKSRDGQRRRESDRDTELTGVRDDVTALRKIMTVYMDGMNRGDPSEVQAQISQINQEAAQSQSNRDWDSRYEKEQTRLLATLQDDNENLLINEEDALKIQDRWKKAWESAQRGNFEEVYDTQIEAQRMVNQEERRKADTDRKVLREEAKSAAKKALERHGINDLDTGSAIAGGNEELHGAALIERGLRNRQSRL